MECQTWVAEQVVDCPRCRQDHREVLFQAMTNLPGERWGMCPVTMQPILLNTQPSVDAVAKVIALHSTHRGHDVDVEAVWDSLPEQTKELWRGTATKLMATFFVRAKFGTN